MPLAAVVGLLSIVVLSRLDYFETIFRSRVRTGGGASQAHFGVYDFIPDILSTKPFFGLGLNNFSVYYEQVTGKTNWGPHSFYVALLVETGLVARRCSESSSGTCSRGSVRLAGWVARSLHGGTWRPRG